MMRDRLSLAPLLTHCAIDGYLQFAAAFYRANPASLPDFRWFTSVLLPLFASPLLAMFHGPLEQLCVLFNGYFDDAALATVQYLLRHWPVTHFPKVELFLESAARAAAARREDLRRRIARPLFARIAEVLGSGHFWAAGAALRLLGDDRFLGLFAADARAAFGAVHAGVAALVHSNSADERALAVNAMVTLSRRSPVSAHDSQPRGEDARLEKWRFVRSAAGEDGT
jgi:hypothetical protein